MHPKTICDWISASWYFVATVLVGKVVSGKILEVRDREVAIARPDGSRGRRGRKYPSAENTRGEVTRSYISQRKVMEQIAARLAAIGESSHDAILPGS
jgi:hypothetical protein